MSHTPRDYRFWGVLWCVFLWVVTAWGLGNWNSGEAGDLGSWNDEPRDRVALVLVKIGKPLKIS
jgi:hypothetical protein